VLAKIPAARASAGAAKAGMKKPHGVAELGRPLAAKDIRYEFGIRAWKRRGRRAVPPLASRPLDILHYKLDQRDRIR
jgi:hypothetical protein